MSSLPARSTSTRPSAGAWPVGETSHERDHRDRTVHPRPDPQNPGRLEDAESSGGAGPNRASTRARRNQALEVIDTLFAEELTLREHVLGPPRTGKSHLATALVVEAVKAGRSVYFASLADNIGAL